MISKFLDPKNDMAFKKIFGTEKNKEILIHFLNDMLSFKERQPISEVQFLQTVQDPIIAARKTSIVDILCKDDFGNSYIVEMQVAKERGFIKRSQYYAAKTYCSQLKKRGKYPDLKEIIFLAIADFKMFPDKANYKSDHITLDRETYENDLKDFSYTFLELEKFNVPIEQLKTMTEKWAYFFKYANETTVEDLEKIIGKDLIIEKAYEQLDRYYWTEEELFDYEAATKKAMDFEATMDQKFEDGMQEGIQRGIKEGIQREKIETAKNMLNLSLDIKLISQATGLSIKIIKDLKK
jgi:predicted transposase/invertase (TIGR01784 family)